MTNVQTWSRRIPRIYTENDAFGIEHADMQAEGLIVYIGTSYLFASDWFTNKGRKIAKGILIRNTGTSIQHF